MQLGKQACRGSFVRANGGACGQLAIAVSVFVRRDLYDETQQVARAYGAVCTPELFGFDADLRLRYRGRLDASRKEAIPDARRELFEAMQQIAQTGTGPEAQYPALGCSIKWKDAA